MTAEAGFLGKGRGSWDCRRLDQVRFHWKMKHRSQMKATVGKVRISKQGIGQYAFWGNQEGLEDQCQLEDQSQTHQAPEEMGDKNGELLRRRLKIRHLPV